MNSNREILQDLYALDPSLKKKEAELVKLLNELRQAKPRTSFDSKFYKTLRTELKRHEDLPIYSFNFMKILSFAAVFAVVLLVPIFNQLKTEESPFIGVEEHAFGDLGAFVEISGLGGGGFEPITGINYTFNYVGPESTFLYEKVEVLKPIAISEMNFPEVNTYTPYAGPLLSEDEVVEIFENFLEVNGFSRLSYGNLLTLSYGQNDEGYTGIASLNFEFVIDGRRVYGPMGHPLVSAVSVDMVLKKVVHLSTHAQNYELSNYESTSWEEVLNIAQIGGFDPYQFVSDSDSIPLELGMPEEILVETVTGDGQTVLYIPALRFPILDKPADLDREYVVVPLVKEMTAALEQSSY